MRYEQEGVDMPVAAKFPVRIDPMLSSKVVIAQLVMLGYSHADSEDAVDAVRVHDTELALEWLEGRNVRKTSMLREQIVNRRSSSFGSAARHAGAEAGQREQTHAQARRGCSRRRHPRGRGRPRGRSSRPEDRATIPISPTPRSTAVPNTGATTIPRTCTGPASAR